MSFRILLVLFLSSALAYADDADKTVRVGVTTTIGQIGLSMHNVGNFGNELNPAVSYPSCEWPTSSNVEHIHQAGIWVAAISAEGDTLVSAGGDDRWSAIRQEFGPRNEDDVTQISSNPLSARFSTRAKADQQFEMVFDDLHASNSNQSDPHFPLGVRVYTTVFAYAPSYADDFVIINFEVENISGTELVEVYLGFYCEFSVGNVVVTIPQGNPSWNYFDDRNGYVGEGDLPDDPDIRLMYSYDVDGENGQATSWIGVRWLGQDFDSDIYSFRQWQYGGSSWPRVDREKFGYMSSGQIDVGETGAVPPFTAILNWSNLMATGPIPTMFPDDRAQFTVAFVAGADSVDLVRNSQVAQATFDRGFDLPSGPPSPLLEVTTLNNGVRLRWKPGVRTDPYDAALSSPEFHRSEFTSEYDFQGYRIYRILGDTISRDPFDQASLLAEFDITETPDGVPDEVGFNTGLPPLVDGMREFIDTNVLNGFNYYYAVTSFAARNPRLGLPELESGFNENVHQVKPGTAPGGPSRPAVGVFPNPYRASSLFDTRGASGEPRELGRQIYFTNVPARAIIEVYNLSGALIDRFRHDDATTGQVEWSMLSQHTRAIAPGLYIYVVEDLDTREVQRGKLVILK